MRLIIAIIVSLISIQVTGQHLIYNSNYSIHIPSHIKEDIPRVINIYKDSIEILSDAGNGITDIQTMIIHSKVVKVDREEATTIYDCTSPDGIFPSKVLIKENPIYLVVIQPSTIPGKLEEYHLYLEQYN